MNKNYITTNDFNGTVQHHYYSGEVPDLTDHFGETRKDLKEKELKEFYDYLYWNDNFERPKKAYEMKTAGELTEEFLENNNSTNPIVVTKKEDKPLDKDIEKNILFGFGVFAFFIILLWIKG